MHMQVQVATTPYLDRKLQSPHRPSARHLTCPRLLLSDTDPGFWTIGIRIKSIAIAVSFLLSESHLFSGLDLSVSVPFSPILRQVEPVARQEGSTAELNSHISR